MAEGTSPAAKKAKTDGDCAGTASDGCGSATGAVNGNRKIAFVTGITGQVKAPEPALHRWLAG